LDAAQAQAFVEQHDKHGGGVLDIEEFLRAMLPPAPAPAPLAAAHTPERTSWLEAEAALAALAARPQREGKYFTAHRSLLPHIEYTGEPVEAAAEFWPHHPNDGHPLLPEFVMVRLTDDQIREQRDLIRLSSYRHTAGTASRASGRTERGRRRPTTAGFWSCARSTAGSAGSTSWPTWW